MVETLGSRPQPPGVGIHSFEIVLPLTVLIFEPFFPVDFYLTIVDHTAKPPDFLKRFGACGGASSKAGFVVEGRTRCGGPSLNNEAVPATASIDSGKRPGRTNPPTTAP